MRLPDRFGPLGEKWEKEKGKTGQPTWPLGAHVGGQLDLLGHINPTWLGQGERLPLPTI